MTSENTTIWNQPEWQATAHDWIRTQLANQQITVTDAIEQIHLQPWSTILRVPTSHGNVFFKAIADEDAHETAFTAFLSRLQPDSLPELLAVDGTKGWMIMRDAGTRLREVLLANLDMGLWEEALPIYASLQIAASRQVSDILALGVPYRGLKQLPQLYRQLITHVEIFRIDMPEDSITSAQYQRLNDLADVVALKCEQLASYNIPESIQHGDLHDGNIFADAPRYRFLDWGDASIAHPFFSLRTTYVSAEIRFKLEEGAPELNRLRDAYLIPWRQFETEARLLEAFGLTQELWPIGSMLAWHHTISNLDMELKPKFAYILPSLAQELLAQIKV